MRFNFNLNFLSLSIYWWFAGTLEATTEATEEENGDELQPTTSRRHSDAREQRTELNRTKKEKMQELASKLTEGRKKTREQLTVQEQADEVIDALDRAYDVEEDITNGKFTFIYFAKYITFILENDRQFDIFNAAMAEGGIVDPELEQLRKENSELRERQRILTNEKKAMQKRMKSMVERHKRTNTNMQKQLQRRKVSNVRQAKKPFNELQSRTSRLEAVTKFITLLAGIFTCYSNADFWAISRKAWPDTYDANTVLSPPETWQFMCFINVSFTKMRAIRKYLKKFKLNIFSSERSIFSLIKKAAHTTITKVYSIAVNSVPLNLRCAQVRSLREVIKQRVQAQIKSGRFPKNLKILQLCIGFDKGGTSTKMGLMMGSIRRRNGPRGMSLLALYEGNETPEELTAAFGSIIEECRNIKMIQIGDRKIYVRFRFTGDLKCLKACLGLKSGNAKYPCLYCLQQKEKNFGSFPAGVGAKREHYHMNIGTSTGQGHAGCLSWISPEQIVIPSLHLLMGVAESLFDHLISRIITRKAVGDINIPDFSKLREKNSHVVEARENLENEREKLNSWKTIAEKLRSGILPIPETRYPDGIDESNAEDWMGDICGCSTCVAEITDLVIPSRHSSTITSEVPDWIWSDAKQMWFHSVCLGLTSDQSRIALDVEHYDPQMPTFENILNQINVEIEWANSQVQKAEKQLDETLSKLNLPKEVTDLPAVNAFFKVFEKFGAYRSLWFQRFTGNQIHQILKSTIPTEKRPYTLRSKLLEEDEIKALLERGKPGFDEEFSQGLEALRVLGDIQSKFNFSKFQK